MEFLSRVSLLLGLALHAVARLLFEPVVEAGIALGGDLGRRLDAARLVITLLRLVGLQDLLTDLTQIRIGNFQILRLLLIWTN